MHLLRRRADHCRVSPPPLIVPLEDATEHCSTAFIPESHCERVRRSRISSLGSSLAVSFNLPSNIQFKHKWESQLIYPSIVKCTSWKGTCQAHIFVESWQGHVSRGFLLKKLFLPTVESPTRLPFPKMRYDDCVVEAQLFLVVKVTWWRLWMRACQVTFISTTAQCSRGQSCRAWKNIFDDYSLPLSIYLWSICRDAMWNLVGWTITLHMSAWAH